MRLLNTKTNELVNFYNDDIPPYAILSHTWDMDEVTLQEFESLPRSEFQNNGKWSTYKYTKSLEKIQGCCEQARKDNLCWVWIDTCCIDKANNSELSEAINSMFKWYQRAEVCYAYLPDICGLDIMHHTAPKFTRSRWFTRGWTLQELLAPKEVYFFDSGWTYIGDKNSLCGPIHAVTGIPKHILTGGNLYEVSIAQRMSWASKRKTSRKEDNAYCLLGIFNVNMPLLYGEEDKAFVRLQKEIIKTTDDDSIFAWGIHTDIDNADGFGVLAKSPRDFADSGTVVQCRVALEKGQRNFEVTSRGLKMIMPLSPRMFRGPEEYGLLKLGVLNCRLARDDRSLLAIPLVATSKINPSALWEDDPSLMTRPRRLAIAECEENSMYHYRLDTILAGDKNEITYENDRRAAVVRYRSQRTSKQYQLYDRDFCMILPRPRGYYNWNLTLVHHDDPFQVQIGRHHSNHVPQASDLGDLSEQPFQSVYLLYTMDDVDSDYRTTFLVKITVERPWRFSLPLQWYNWIPEFHRQNLAGRVTVSFSWVPTADTGKFQDPNCLRKLDWWPTLWMGSRYLKATIRYDPDFAQIILNWTEQSSFSSWAIAVMDDLERGISFSCRPSVILLIVGLLLISICVAAIPESEFFALKEESLVNGGFST